MDEQKNTAAKAQVPITDVVAAPKPDPLVTGEEAPKQPVAKAEPTAKKDVPKQPKEPKQHGPVAAITLAIFIFIALSGLAYYAYTKTK
jgi:hypothetical protein